jgi:anti-anti-sigma factor
MRAVTTGHGHQVGLTLIGELDHGTALQVGAAMRRTLDPPGWHDGVIFSLDLSSLSFCDVIGLDALTDVYTQVMSRGGTLRVVPPAARGPSMLLTLAVNKGWLPSVFIPRPSGQAGSPTPSSEATWARTSR